MRLSINMREENDGDIKMLLMEIPPALLPQNDGNIIISSRAVFDIVSDTLLETEVVMKLEDDTIVTTTVTPVYEENNGVPVKIGQITVIDSKAPGLIDDIDMPVYDSPDDIPTISDAELTELEAAGAASDIYEMTFGDQRDLSNVETIFEVYQNIEINAVPEHLFRLFK